MAMSEYVRGLWELIKKNHRGIITIVAVVIIIVFFQACQITTPSIMVDGKRVTRAELQLELETIQQKAEIGLADLDRQEALAALLVQNAVILASGGTVNPLGILTGVAALYGIAAAGSSVVSTVRKNSKAKEETTTTV